MLKKGDLVILQTNKQHLYPWNNEVAVVVKQARSCFDLIVYIPKRRGFMSIYTPEARKIC